MKIKTRRYYIYYTAKALFFLVRFLPRKIALGIADFLGRVAFFVLGYYRRLAISNLDRAFGNNRSQNIRIARDVFRNLAKNGMDWIKLVFLDKKGLGRLVTETHGFENLDKILAEGKGLILLTFHFGNWELLSLYLSSIGYEGAIIARKIYFYKYDKFIVKLRERFGVKVVYRDESPKKLLSILKDGKILGILADQDIDSVEGVFVDFFRRPAYTPIAPVRFAIAARVSLVPVLIMRKPDDTYKVIVEKPISPIDISDKTDAVKKYTQIWTSLLERYIREYPEQWVWVHNRWKTEDN